MRRRSVSSAGSSRSGTVKVGKTPPLPFSLVIPSRSRKTMRASWREKAARRRIPSISIPFSSALNTRLWRRRSLPISIGIRTIAAVILLPTARMRISRSTLGFSSMASTVVKAFRPAQVTSSRAGPRPRAAPPLTSSFGLAPDILTTDHRPPRSPPTRGSPTKTSTPSGRRTR